VIAMRCAGLARSCLSAALCLLCGNAAAQSCTVAPGGRLAFQNIVALASNVDQSTDSVQSLRLGCDSGVTGALRLYSSTPRVLRNGAHAMPFNLSLNSGAASDDLPVASPGAQIAVVRDGQEHALTLYAKIFVRDFQSLPGGMYSASVTLTLEY
jgi:spore coat protein U-like protein